MEVPTIPETGINEIILEQINEYISTLIEQMVRYGNSIPSSTRDEYFKQITKDFQEWYKKYPEVHSIECVKQALIFCSIAKEENEEEEEEQYVPFRRTKPRTTLDDESGSDDDYEDYKMDNQPDDYYQ